MKTSKWQCHGCSLDWGKREGFHWLKNFQKISVIKCHSTEEYMWKLKQNKETQQQNDRKQGMN